MTMVIVLVTEKCWHCIGNKDIVVDDRNMNEDHIANQLKISIEFQLKEVDVDIDDDSNVGGCTGQYGNWFDFKKILSLETN